MFLVSAVSILRHYPEVLLTLYAFKFFSQMLSFTQHTDATCAPPTHMKKALFISSCSMWHVDNILFIKLLPCGAHSVPRTENHHQWDLWLHSLHNSSSLIANSTLQPSSPSPFCFNLTAFCVHFKGQHGPQGSTGWQVWRKIFRWGFQTAVRTGSRGIQLNPLMSEEHVCCSWHIISHLTLHCQIYFLYLYTITRM